VNPKGEMKGEHYPAFPAEITFSVRDLEASAASFVSHLSFSAGPASAWLVWKFLGGAKVAKSKSFLWN
jgi:hypothetical protein